MLICPRCGDFCEGEDRYCGACGERLMDSTREVEGGRTQKSMNLADLRYKLGFVYYRKGDLSSAIRNWRWVLENNPDYADLNELVQKAETKRTALRTSW